MSPTGTKVRVLVVNGDTMLRQGLARLLGMHPSVEVVGWAISGRTALPKVVAYTPDLILLDLDQNVSEGMELLGKLGETPGLQKLVIAPSANGAETLQHAAQLGAVDVVRRPAGVQGDAFVTRLVQEVLPPLLRLGQGVLGGGVRRPLAPVPPVLSASPAPSIVATPAAPSVAASCPLPTSVGAAGGPLPRLPCMPRPPLVLGIGVSTGGPKALTQLLPMLPADFPVPILLVQHMPPKFTQSLAESLDKVCKLRVAEAKDNDRVERGRILIAPGGMHMRIAQMDGVDHVRLSDDPPECSCRPSVDYLFRSLVERHGGRVLGVVLTGMGEDGWIGSRRIHAAGGRILAQDEASATVYGMPRGPIEAGIATAVPLAQMAEAIVQVVRGVPCS